MAKLAHPLHLGPAVYLAFTLSAGCGEDAQDDYAGLEVASRTAPNGVGYRIRFADPPWSSSPNDPLARGTDTTIELLGDKNHPYVAGTGLVLEIERESIIQDSSAKYRLEATLVDCDTPASAGRSCAELVANADNDARTKEGETSWYEDHRVKAATNDFKQKYFELYTRNLDTRRYKRIAFYETPDPTRFLRVYIESNPSLEDAEVTRMLNAVETFEDAQGPAGSSDAGGTP